MVRVQEVGSEERFSQDQLAALQYFHKFSFTHVLRLEKYPIKFDPTNAKTAFYIVPLNKCEYYFYLPMTAAVSPIKPHNFELLFHTVFVVPVL